jgi:23S rRNA maturation-related 3'-5' exoribonuclease YhaM
VANEKSLIFNEILETFEDANVKALARIMIDDIPDYFYDIGASSTGKYHPQYALGDLGLARHTVALCRIMNYIFSLEQTQEDFTPRERDLLRLAGIMHDSRKCGETKSRYTVFEHPLMAASAVRRYKGVIPLY